MYDSPPPAPHRPLLKRTWFRLVLGLAAGWNLLGLLIAAAMLISATDPRPITAEPAPTTSVAPDPTERSTPSRAGSPTPSDTGSPAAPTRSPEPRASSAAPSKVEPPKAEPTAKPPKAKPTPSKTVTAGTALGAVAALTVKGRAPKTGYDRDQFGQRWADLDRNGCDQRNDVLRRDLSRFSTKAGTSGCLVLTGVLDDPYTGERIRFSRERASEVQIDHVVALSDAWQKGAQQWSPERRERFANDFLNLAAVDGGANASKSDNDTSGWLPANKRFRCSYVARQVAVKTRYGLWVTRAERDAMVRVLSGCPDRKLPSTRSATPPERDPATDVEPAPEPEPEPAPKPKDPGGPKGDCEPGYSPCVPLFPPDVDCSDVDGPIRVTGRDPHGLDGDGDGWGCTS